MRSIKFRVWDSERRVMEEVGAMDWADGKNGLEIITVNTETEKHYKMPDDWGKQEFVVMQFTGLKDKNGKEIYEGDINVDDDGKKSVIVFYAAGFYLQYSPTELKYIGSLAPFHRNVIGNIYENPDLIKE